MIENNNLVLQENKHVLDYCLSIFASHIFHCQIVLGDINEEINSIRSECSNGGGLVITGLRERA